MDDVIFSLLWPLAGVTVVILTAYFGTRYLSARYARLTAGRNIRVIERVALAQDKSLVLITVNQRAYLLGVTGKSIAVVCDFEESGIQPPPSRSGDFFSVFSEGMKKKMGMGPDGFTGGTDGRDR